MIFKGGAAAALSVLAIILCTLSAGSETKGEEAIFAVRYEKFTNDYIVYVDRDSVFVPFEEVLSNFKIYYETDDQRNIAGYVNNKDSSFSILFNEGYFLDIDGEKHKLKSSTWFPTEFQVYVRTDLLEEIFKFEARTLFNQLAVQIKSKYELPIKRSLRVEYVSNNFRRSEEEDEFAPLISKRKFIVLNGGILDYSIGGTKTAAGESYNYSAGLGMAVLNGGLSYRSYGNVNSGEFDSRDFIKWNYDIDSKFLRSITLGNLTNTGLRGNSGRGYRKPFMNLRGVSITNEDFETPTVFTDYVVEDEIEPDWIVELYVDDNLYDVKRSDMTGYYRFEVPISYGSTNIEVKYYGKNGEFISSKKALNIPSSYLRSGEIKYSVAGGENVQTKEKALDASCNLGLTDRLTVSVSGNKIFGSDKYLIVGRSFYNLFGFVGLEALGTNTGIYGASLKLDANNIGNFDFYYTHYDQSFEENSSQGIGRFQMNANFSGVFNLPFSISLMADRNLREERNSNSVYANLMFGIKNINFQTRYNMYFMDDWKKIDDLRQNVDLSATTSLAGMHRSLSFLRRSRISFHTEFVPEDLRFTNVNLSFDQNIAKVISLTTNATYNIDYDRFNVNVGLAVNTSSFRSRNTARYSPDYPSTYSSSISGSLEFDSYNLHVTPVNSIGSGNYGRSSAAIRFFEDVNYDGKFDDEDILIPQVDFHVTSGFVSKKKTMGYTLLSSLKPGKRYNIMLKPESLPDPALIPEKHEFSFIAEPYTYKAIDIPCQRGAIIEGSVTIKNKDGEVGRGGLKIKIVSKDSSLIKEVMVFSDGSYFFSGLPKGFYDVYVDEKQLDILNAESDPEVREIEINPPVHGDFVEDLNFTLYPNDYLEELALTDNSQTTLTRNSFDAQSTRNFLEFDEIGALSPESITALTEIAASLLDGSASGIVLTAPDWENSDAESIDFTTKAIEFLLDKGVTRNKIATVMETEDYFLQNHNLSKAEAEKVVAFEIE